MNISVLVPLLNEEDSLNELCSWIDKVMKKSNFSYEVLLIDDGSKDNSWKIIEDINKKVMTKKMKEDKQSSKNTLGDANEQLQELNDKMDGK